MYYISWIIDGRLNSYCTGSWDKLMARLVSLPDGTPVKGGTLIPSDPDDLIKQLRRG